MKKKFKLSEKKKIDGYWGSIFMEKHVKEFIRLLKDKQESMRIRLNSKAFETKMTNGVIKSIILFKDFIEEMDNSIKEIDKLAGEDLIWKKKK